MTSRRPMTRSYSGNGRSGSQNGEDVSSPRLDSRNYLSNVRPENRSTFCTVMAQLTEETQPCFETTVKSRAVSEACNVKFSCVVTGYPAPELTWYKDDMELDRYCGLPKYEIFRNGKTHTLHIYNCTVDDAAIYQASARNSKGIVSCSGVLEVGAMTEYEIHQRFFAKLKQKAELKRRELDESRRRGKENVQHELLNISQDRSLRKRRLPEGTELNSLSALNDAEHREAKEEPATEEHPKVGNEELNGLSVEINELSSSVSQENDMQQLNHFNEKADIGGTKQATIEKLSRKKIRISNGFEEPVTNQANQGTGGLGDSSEGISLAKYLSESLQSHAAEEQQKTQVPEITGPQTDHFHEKDRQSEKSEKERMKSKEKERERSREREQERSRHTEVEHRTLTEFEAQALAHKEPEHQHKSALSSMFSSIKGIFFGKSKKLPDTSDASKKVNDLNIEKEIPLIGPEEHPHPLQTQPQELNTISGLYGMTSEQLVPMDVDQPHQPGDLHVNRDSLHQVSLQPKIEMENLDLNYHTHGFRTDNTQDTSQNSERHNGAPVSSFQEYGEQNTAEQKEGQEALPKAPSLLLFAATDDHTAGNTIVDMVHLPREMAGLECTASMDQVTQANGELHATEERDDTADFTQKPEASLTGLNMTALESTESCAEGHLSQPVSHVPLWVASKYENEEEIIEHEKRAECELHATVDVAVEDVSQESRLKMQEGYAFDKGSEDIDKMGVAIAQTRETTETEAVEMTKRSTLSVQESRQEHDHFQNESTLQLDVSQSDSALQNCIIKQQVVTTPIGADHTMDENLRETDVTKISIFEGKKDNVNEDHVENTEEMRTDVIEKKGDVYTGENISTPEQATFNIKVEPEISKYTRQSEIDGIDNQLSSSITDKPKIFPKTQPERYVVESKDQSGAPPMIILPDTRETVIKNVAKMRATPLIPEIKVTSSEKVKREETVSVSRIDILVSEPERVMQPLAQEVAHMFRENEPKSEETDDTKRPPSEITRDVRQVNIAQTVGVTLTQQERNEDLTPSDQRNQEGKPQNEEARLCHREDQAKSTSGWNRGNDSSSIPIISIACADDVTASEERQEYGKPALQEVVLSDNVAPKMQTYTVPSISTRHIEGSPENNIKNEMSPDSLVSILRKDEVDMGHVGSPNRTLDAEKSALLKEQNLPDKKNLETQMSTDVPSVKTSDLEPDADRLQKDKPAMEKLGLTTPVGPTLPPLSPASLRRLMAKNNPNLESQGSIPAISADGSEKKGDESGGSTPTSALSCESSPKMKRRDSLTLIPSATPEELASGARRKIYLAKTKSEDEGSDTQNKRDSPKMSPSQARRAAFLQLQSGQQTPPMERRSPLLGRRKTTLEVPKPKEDASEENDNSNTESKPAEKEKLDPFKAPQVIRKIRGEPFSDASGHLKLWCQFFNVLSDSTIKWFKDEEEILEMKRSAGDESQVVLAIVQASSRDCGVYGCTIKNEYGTDTTDYLLSEDILAEFFLRDDLEVGEEIEMTPLLFTKGLADSGYWGDKFFGRIMTEEVQIGEGCTHKTSRAKVIYGLDPVFESGSTCIVKVRNPIAYGTKEENSLTERNLEVIKQECKIQNTVREYCKIFAAEARVNDNFGFSLEVVPLYMMYRPANTIPYATVEADLTGVYLIYCQIDNTGTLITQTSSEVEQKCCSFQHWIHQWTNGNLLVTRLEGVDTKITNVRVATKSKGYQGLTDEGSPKTLEQFVTQHQCNYYCGLLGLRPLKLMDSLQQPKVKTSRSPLIARRVGTGSTSPQLQKKGSVSPQANRKGNSSPKVVKKTDEDEENKPTTKHKTVEVPKAVRMR